jgi:hypothetical protein
MTERAASPDPNENEDLGPLAQLRGIWGGFGFNILCLPVQETKRIPPDNLPFRVKVNSTIEEMDFRLISSAEIPNRGFTQPDLQFLGLHYTQRITDRNGEGGLHFEQGLWLNAPDPLVPVNSLYRLGSIPHGGTFLATNTEVLQQWDNSPPDIPDVDPRPFQTNQPGQRIISDTYLSAFFNTPLPEGVNPQTPPGPSNRDGLIAGPIGNPNLVLKTTNAQRHPTRHIKFTVSCNSANISNIPFVNNNAPVTSMSSTFWISEFEGLFGRRVLQLQYSQTVILTFDKVDWPHISVATLIKPFG